jgi:hypothetical protein
MTASRRGANRITRYRNCEGAAFIYFDAPISWSSGDDIIAIELGARAMAPAGDVEDERDGDVTAELEGHVVGRLRCSRTAARRLRDVISQMLDHPQGAVAPAVIGKLN